MGSDLKKFVNPKFLKTIDPALMRTLFVRHFGEDEETYGIVGLLHDFDYERWPNPPDHPLKGADILTGSDGLSSSTLRTR